MVIDNLKARCVNIVAREAGRTLYEQRVRGGVAEEGDAAWREAIKEMEPRAASMINCMDNMQLLDLISEVLVSD